MSVSDDAFRTELRSWLAEHPPPAIDVAATAEDAAILRDWQRTLHAGRWVGINWPAEYGGRGAPLTQGRDAATRNWPASPHRRCSVARASRWSGRR